MPTYDYRCEANGTVYEVQHPMSVTVTNWGELKPFLAENVDALPDSTPVSKILNTGGVVKSSALKNPEPPCGAGGCASGRCQFQ